MVGLKKITDDLNYLDINKYLFNKSIVDEVDKIIQALNKVKIRLEDCLSNKNSEKELQFTLESLSSVLKYSETKLVEKIKNIISVKQ